MPDAVSLPPLYPHSLSEPLGAGTAASITASRERATREWWTHCEQTDYAETGKYAETVDFVSRLSELSSLAHVKSFGRSARAVPLTAVILPAQQPEARKPVIWLQSAIHGGEAAGKDATLLLLRDLIAGGMYSHWLERCTLVFIPVLNVDGHDMFSEFNRFNQNGPKESGWRANAQRLDLNRDFIKASSPEIRAWHSLFNSMPPDCVIDNHTSDGIDHQYDAMFKWPAHPFVSRRLSEWVRTYFAPSILSGMDRDGHVPGLYFEIEEDEQIDRGLAMEVRPPRFCWSYVACRNRVPLLIESHSLKRYKTQVWAHYDAMVHAVEAICANAATLVSAESTDSSRVFLDGRVRSDESAAFTFKGLRSTQEPCEISGASRTVYRSEPFDRPTTLKEAVEATLTIELPKAYLVPAEWPEVIDLLHVHGIESSQISNPQDVEAEQYLLSEARWEESPYEGRLRLHASSACVRRQIRIPAGAVMVPANQSRARLIAHLLEPDAPDSLFRWGFFNTIFEMKEYGSDFLLPQLAKRMLEASPALREEFELRLNADPQFAADPPARLEFFYRRSPYAEAGLYEYPVLRLMR